MMPYTMAPPHLVTGLPAGRAHLIRVALDVLDGLQHALGLVHGAAKAQVVDGGVLRGNGVVSNETWRWGQQKDSESLLGCKRTEL